MLFGVLHSCRSIKVVILYKDRAVSYYLYKLLEVTTDCY